MGVSDQPPANKERTAGSVTTNAPRTDRPPRPSPYNEENIIPILDPPLENPVFPDNDEAIVLGTHRDVHPSYPLPPFITESPDQPCMPSCNGRLAQWFMDDLVRGLSPLGRVRMEDGSEVVESIGQFAFQYGQYYKRMARRERRVSNRLNQARREAAAALIVAPAEGEVALSTQLPLMPVLAPRQPSPLLQPQVPPPITVHAALTLHEIPTIQDAHAQIGTSVTPPQTNHP